MDAQSKRKLKDLCALCHNALLEYQKVSQKAWPVLEQFANKRAALLEINCKQDKLSEMSMEDERSFEHLRSSIDKLAALIQQLSTISIYLNGLIELVSAQNETDCNDKAFKELGNVHDTVEDVLSSLKQDFECKRAIVSEIGITDSKDLVVTYLAMWLHEPCIPDSSFSYPILLLRSMASIKI
ncbi:Cyclin-dependent kinase 2-interacting protein [Trichuris trichiura]|uniref:Cyclin-dependent kinase 2-interacting protein n=1 Tax=Trichuris trichiura TaxID=36087 RepID=A0A077ZI80_TRITR|nr:Cyclin-dependent kinase 2-interacting protein [Trichuris trichiura]